MWGRGLIGSNGACSALCWFSVTPPLPSSKLGPCGADSQVGGFVYVLRPCGSLQRTFLWGWEFLLLPGSQGFLIRDFEALFPHAGNLGHFPVFPPVLSVGLPAFPASSSPALLPHLPWSSRPIHTQMWDFLVHQPLPCCESSPPHLPVCAPPTSLDEYFFNSLVVKLPYSSIFWQFWLFLVFKFVVVLPLVVQAGKVYLSMPPSWPEVLKWP